MCRPTKQLIAIALTAAGVGMALALLLSNTFFSALLTAALIAGGLFLLNS